MSIGFTHDYFHVDEETWLKKVGERIDCAGWQFEVLALDGRRIDRVRARALEEPAEAGLSTQDSRSRSSIIKSRSG